MGRLTA